MPTTTKKPTTKTKTAAKTKTVAKKAPAKKAPAKKAPAKNGKTSKNGKKPAAKKEASKEVGNKRGKVEGMTSAQYRALSLLRGTKANHGMDRAALAEATGVQKGWARVLGAASKGGAGAAGNESLMAKGFVQAEKHEGQPFSYCITADGKKALTKADKEMKAK